jgi:quinohemoprotein ethanol dehydrogenase
MRIATAHDDRNLQDFDNPHQKYFPVQASESELIKLDPDDGTAGLLGWDPVAQKKRWEVHYTDSFWNGGTMTTAGGLVFQGTGRGQFLAYDAGSGWKLWSFDTGLGVIAAPATYEVDDVQYISLLVGYGGSAGNGTDLFDYGWRFNEQPRRLLTFALNKHEPLPPTNPPRFALRAVDNPTLAIDSKTAADGEKVYNSGCFLCHGAHLESTGSIAPDLRESRLAMNWDSFTAVVHEGSLAGAGMPKYGDLTETDLNALYMYIRRMARDSLAAAH